MTGYSDYWARKLLDLSTGKTSVTLPTVYIALFTAVGTDANTGFTEVTGSGYTRVTTAAGNWNAAASSAPASTSNSASLTFPSASGSWGTIIAMGAFDAVTTGNLLWWDYLGSFAWIPFTCTLASPGVITVPAHGFSNGDQIVVTTEYGGSLPTTSGSWSGLLTVAGSSTDTFNAAVNTTSTGNGTLRKVTTVAVTSGNTPLFNGGTPGDLQITLA